jgi:hypothetical protein
MSLWLLLCFFNSWHLCSDNTLDDEPQAQIKSWEIRNVQTMCVRVHKLEDCRFPLSRWTQRENSHLQRDVDWNLEHLIRVQVRLMRRMVKPTNSPKVRNTLSATAPPSYGLQSELRPIKESWTGPQSNVSCVQTTVLESGNITNIPWRSRETQRRFRLKNSFTTSCSHIEKLLTCKHVVTIGHFTPADTVQCMRHGPQPPPHEWRRIMSDGGDTPARTREEGGRLVFFDGSLSVSKRGLADPTSRYWLIFERKTKSENLRFLFLHVMPTFDTKQHGFLSFPASPCKI